ncbi:hypothetical protein CRM22_009240 [Opisthorchis felineus]|uniref:Protein kinase domain-containing protein n=1 Tax=Opisthorchis felineus TaxID=147828 RepID=A0A4S2L878_OPIFE|nr:hypothetical protein CRM22_009240 [Opisthorchis felineus]TGZ59144.1 hypothetical protein CRM22_009240 [Opisthorchis felineus]
MCLPAFVSLVLLALKLHPGYTASPCLSSSEILTWNRHLYFDKKTFTLKLAVTDDPVHQLVNHIFAILARERLGYQNVEFVHLEEDDDIARTIDELKPSDRSHTSLPNVHLNLLLWLPSGIDINHWAPPSTITDHGPLGPTRQWELRSQSEFSGSSRSKKNTWSFKFENSCSENPSAYFERISALIDREVHSNDSSFTGQPVTVYEWTVEGPNIKSNTHKWIDPPLCGTLSSLTPGNGETISTTRDSDDKLCRTESYQAVKISWANLSSISPPIHKLASRIYLADYDFEELRRKVARLRVGSSALEGFFHESACSWLRRNPSKWVSWTEGWNQKLNLTVAWMSDSIYFGLKQVAEQAIALLNGAASYFRDTEYAFTLHAHHCQDGMALNEYFKILAGSAENRLIGTIAAIPSDRMESVVELSNLRKKLILSPTLATAQFLERRRYPYFFRTIPAMTQANYILLRLFLKWNWRRLVILRKRDHFFNARLFQAKNIEIIDMQLEEQQLTYKKARHSLENLKKLNSRIFVVEYEAVGTYRVLCAAYHLGMHFDAGYVWFLNPWLSDGWWQHESLSGIKECTHQQIANISSFTFSVGHQWMIPDLYFSEDESFVSPLSSSLSSNHSADRNDLLFHNKTSSPLHVGNTKRQNPGAAKQRPKRQAVGDRSRISAALRNSSHSYNLFDDSNQSKWYQAYTTDAVIALGVAVVNLLKSNPWALFELDRPQIAETLRDLVSQTNSAPFGLFKTYFISSLFRSPLGLHFNSLNERVASHWVVKQTRGNTTVPVFWWSVIQKQPQQPVVSAAHHNQSTSQTTDSKTNSTVDGEVSDQNKTNVEIQDLLDAFASFERHTSMNIADKVDWSRNGGPPPDGSQVADTCAFPFLSNTLRMGCTGATVFVAVSITLVCLIPVILASLHYRRKLREAERLTRKPFEELCEELADLDIAMEAIVLNRHIGQGAFGLVFGGEVKTNGTWEAVAVKVLNEKATYEGKIDFLSEAKLMRSLEHRNVVRLIGISLNLKNTIYLIMELMLLGDLKTYLLSRRILAQRSPDHEDIRPSTLTNMSIDIAQGVQYLHSKNLIHRDIACRNCLVASDHVVKIGDFGLTRERTTNRPDGYYRFTRNCELPIRWMSPEAVQYGMFSVQSDIWSYGITLYEIVTFGVFPYSDMCDVEVVERIKRMEFSISDFLPASARNTVVWNLIRLCCQHQFGDRPSSMDQVLQVLYDYPECVRPFLTDEPPKPTLVTDQTPLVQPVLDGTTVRAPPISGYSVNDSCVSDMGLGAGFRNLRCSSATDFHPLQSSLSLQFGDQLEENAQRVVDTGVRYYYPHRSRLSHSSLHNLSSGGAGDCLKTCSNHSVVVSSACIGEHNHGNLSSSASSGSSSSSQCPGFFLPPSVPQSPQQEAHKPLLLTTTANSFRERTDAKMCSNTRRRSPSLNQSPTLEGRAESLKLLRRDKAPDIAKSTELNVFRRLSGVPQRSLSVTNVHGSVRSEEQTPELTTEEDLTFHSVGTSIFSPVSPDVIRADCSSPFPVKPASGDTHDSCGMDPLCCHSFEHHP